MNRDEPQVAAILHELQERAKELNCLYRVDELLNQPELPLERILRGIVEILPPGWQYPNESVIWMPDAGRDETIAWLQVQIENRSMSILAVGMRKVDANVSLEWPLVVGETGVSIDTKQRAAGGARIGDEKWTDRL